MKLIELIGLIAGIVMPFWNIPLIARIIKRKSSDDISLFWVVGVWICVIAMLPSAILSKELILKYFGIVNALFFTAVFVVVLKYHSPPKSN